LKERAKDSLLNYSANNPLGFAGLAYPLIGLNGFAGLNGLLGSIYICPAVLFIVSFNDRSTRSTRFREVHSGSGRKTIINRTKKKIIHSKVLNFISFHLHGNNIIIT